MEKKILVKDYARKYITRHVRTGSRGKKQRIKAHTGGIECVSTNSARGDSNPLPGSSPVLLRLSTNELQSTIQGTCVLQPALTMGIRQGTRGLPLQLTLRITLGTPGLKPTSGLPEADVSL